MVELAALSDPALVVQAVAESLGVREAPGESLLQALVEFLHPRRFLVLLDNCEHVVEACAALVEALLRACPRLQVLATSREALGIGGEVAWPVPPLALPPPDEPATRERLLHFEAVRLFADRAAAARPGFEVTDANARAVAEICARLDGLPLAIELAAARVRLLSPEQIAARLDDRFHFLTGGRRTALPHQQTLRAAMDWSYELLGAAERSFFQQLSVFAGGCTIEAIEAVVSAAPADAAPADATPAGRAADGARDPAFDLLDALEALVDKSLLLRRDQDVEPRFAMLQTIRDYARERLDQAGDAGGVRQRHFAYYAGLAGDAARNLRARDQLVWLERLDREHDNLRAALDWAATSPESVERGLVTASQLGWFWYLRGHRREGRDRLVALLASSAAAPPAIRSRALGEAAHLAYWSGETETAHDLAEEGYRLARASGEPLALGWALLYRAVVEPRRGEVETFASWWEEALASFQASGELWGQALALAWLGHAAQRRGDLAGAAAQLGESHDRFRALGDRWGMALARTRLASLAEEMGDLARAEAYLREQQALARELGHRGAMAGGLHRLGALSVCRGDIDQAADQFESSAALYRAIGERRSAASPLFDLGLLNARHRQRFDQAAALLRESLAIWQEHGDRVGVLRCLLGYAELALRQGARERAARLLGATEAALTAEAQALDPLRRDDLWQEAGQLGAALDSAELAAPREAGRALSPEQAVAYALAALASPPTGD
jgi:non-specific serine/threonine protein kinase